MPSGHAGEITVNRLAGLGPSPEGPQEVRKPQIGPAPPSEQDHAGKPLVGMKGTPRPNVYPTKTTTSVDMRWVPK
jgi:hypothetical protein